MPKKKLEELDLSPIGFPGARTQAEKIAPGHTGCLAWVDSRCQRYGMHPLDDWWGEKFADFIASGKQDFVARNGIRAAKSVSVSRLVATDALFIQRELDPGTRGLVIIMSVDKREASGRLDNLIHTLSACGIQNTSGENPATLPGGIGGTYTVTRNGNSGGGEIETVDSQGHSILFRIVPLKVEAVLGGTAITVFLDEVDKWKTDRGVNPASEVIDHAHGRIGTQHGTAHVYIVSAAYTPLSIKSAHRDIIDAGDMPWQYVVRLGANGAHKDTQMRAWLATKLGLNDIRLLKAADPLSPNCPTWMSNPKTDIGWCYDDAVRSIMTRKLPVTDIVGYMLALYGGDPGQIPKVGTASMGLDEMMTLADMNRRLVRDDRNPNTFDGGHGGSGGTALVNRYPGLPSWDPRSLQSGIGRKVL